MDGKTPHRRIILGLLKLRYYKVIKFNFTYKEFFNEQS